MEVMPHAKRAGTLILPTDEPTDATDAVTHHLLLVLTVQPLVGLSRQDSALSPPSAPSAVAPLRLSVNVWNWVRADCESV